MPTPELLFIDDTGVEQTTPLVDNPFATLVKYEAREGKELRRVEEGDYAYHGRADDGAVTTQGVWEIVRFHTDPGTEELRTQYRKDVAWTNRATAGW